MLSTLTPIMSHFYHVTLYFSQVFMFCWLFSSYLHWFIWHDHILTLSTRCHLFLTFFPLFGAHLKEPSPSFPFSVCHSFKWRVSHLICLTDLKQCERSTYPVKLYMLLLFDCHLWLLLKWCFPMWIPVSNRVSSSFSEVLEKIVWKGGSSMREKMYWFPPCI